MPLPPKAGHDEPIRKGPWRVERKKVMALAQARQINAILVTELSRWGRSTQDLVQTLDDFTQLEGRRHGVELVPEDEVRGAGARWALPRARRS